MKKTSLFANGLIWFGAAVSIAEIMTGMLLAHQGFVLSTAAIITGHIIGCTFLFLAGLMGARSGKGAMENAKSTFGSKGGILFAFLNIVQLLGWTGIMIYDGSLAANGLWSIGAWVWCIVIGALIVLWVCAGIGGLEKINAAAMSSLFVLTLVLFVLILNKGNAVSDAAPLAAQRIIPFGALLELCAAMPLSWLPLISDYTCEAEKPAAAAAVSSIVYGIVSCWMFFIGMCAANITGAGDIADIMIKAGIGMGGLVIILFSTTVTTFLDAHSSGVSLQAIYDKIDRRKVSVIVTIIGAAGAMFLPMSDITDFLYFIGSVFAPMIGVQIADFFILKKRNKGRYDFINLLVWLAGFGVYRFLMAKEAAVGNTAGYSLPAIAVTMLLAVIVNKLADRFRKE